MDDITIYNESKEFLHALLRDMEEYLQNNLKLSVKDNWQVFPTDIRGVDFVGYRHFYGYKLLRKSTCKNFKRKMLNIKKKIQKGLNISYSEWCSANSYKGWLTWCDGFRLTQKYIAPLQSTLEKYYQENIKRKAAV